MTDQQKKLLGIGGVSAAGLFLYMRRSTTKTATPVTNTSATGSIAPYTPQNPLTLQPGESVYDPNSEALLTTPNGPTTNATPLSPDVPLPFQSGAAAAPSYAVNVTYPSTVKTVKQTVKPAKRTVAKKPAKPAKKKAAK